MGAAPIRACHRRALRHPVPQAPERAFIVARARRKAFLWLRRGFFVTLGLTFSPRRAVCQSVKNGPAGHYTLPMAHV